MSSAAWRGNLLLRKSCLLKRKQRTLFHTLRNVSRKEKREKGKRAHVKIARSIVRAWNTSLSLSLSLSLSVSVRQKKKKLADRSRNFRARRNREEREGKVAAAFSPSVKFRERGSSTALPSAAARHRRMGTAKAIERVRFGNRNRTVPRARTRTRALRNVSFACIGDLHDNVGRLRP